MTKIYKKISFPKSNQPYYYMNAVLSLDGKTCVFSNDPVYKHPSSSKDRETMMNLRSHADVLIHGAKTAVKANTLKILSDKNFESARRKIGKTEALLYLVFTTNPTKELIQSLCHHSKDILPMLITTDNAKISTGLPLQVLKLGKEKINLSALSSYLQQNRYQSILVEGGPTLWHSFFAENIIDEIFLTITPKIFGGNSNQALTLLNGDLIEPGKIKKNKLLSIKVFQNEIFLRYKIIRSQK